MALVELWAFFVLFMGFLHLYAVITLWSLLSPVPLGISMFYLIVTNYVYKKGRIVDQATPLDPTFPHTVLIMRNKRFLRDLEVAGIITAVYVLTFFVTVGIGLWENKVVGMTLVAADYLVVLQNTIHLIIACEEIYKGRFHSPVQETPVHRRH